MIRYKYYILRSPIYLQLILFFALSGEIKAAFEERLYSTRAAALGGAYAASVKTQSAIFGNLSSLAQNNNRRVSVLYGRPFGLNELANSGISLPINTDWGNIEIGLCQFGFSLYHENIISIGIGRNILDNIAAGMAIRYLSTEILGYGSASTVGLDVGFSVKISPKLNIGLTVKNINSPQISKAEKSLAKSLRIGASFAVDKKILLITEFHKEENQTSIYRIGTEIEIFANQYLRFGITNNPSTVSLGFGFSLNQIDINYSFNTHQYLGASQYFSMGYSF